MTPCLLFPFECRGGAANMACDDVLLSIAEAAAAPALRFYEWSVPTLSLGLFQKLTDRGLHSASAACPIVRRSSGGGAIVHDREITYALALPRSHPFSLPTRTVQLYEAVHRSLLAALGTMNIAASLATTVGPARDEPFLCFQRRGTGDVLVETEKIAGSAQRRSSRATLQHGSLLLFRSPDAPELPGVADIAGRPVDAEVLVDRWRAELGKHLDWTFRPTRWTRQQLEMVDCIEAAKYAQSAWTARR